MAAIVAVDAGLSSTKVACSTEASSAPRIFSYPSVAAPLSALSRAPDGSPMLMGGERVRIDDEEWAAGFEQTHLKGHIREFSDRFPDSTDYLALIRTALARSGSSCIELLVVGLPVDEFGQRGRVDALKKRLVGHHRISQDIDVNVRRVAVVPQPFGAYATFAESFAHEHGRSIDRDRMILVVDPGHYTTDWVLIHGGGIHDSSSDSTSSAGREVLSIAARSIGSANPSLTVTVDRLEVAIREGRSSIRVGSTDVDLAVHMDVGARSVAASVMRALNSSLRADRKIVDTVVVAGGGAAMIEPYLREGLPHAEIVALNDPVHANARGFFTVGTQYIRVREQR